MKRIVAVMLAGLCLLFAVHAGGGAEEPNGTGGAKVYPAKDFSSVSIAGGFNFSVRQGNTWLVRISAPAHLQDKVRVVQEGQRLLIELKRDLFNWGPSDGSLNAEVVMPRLSGLEVSGACNGSLLFNTLDEQEFSLEVSGASRLEANLIANKVELDVSGASRLTGRLDFRTLKGEVDGASEFNVRMECPEVELDLSGASRATFKGKGQTLRTEVSGASTLDAEEYPLQTASVLASGASTVEVNVSSRIDAEASGATTVRFWGQGSLGKSRESGASNIRKMD